MTLLGDAGLVALGPDDFAGLYGRTVCSVVYQGTLPDVEVEILNAVEICHGQLTLP